MIKAMRTLRASFTPRQQAALIALLVAAAALLYASLLLSAGPARERLRASVAELRVQSAQMSAQAAEYARLREAPPPGIATADLRSVVQAQVDAAGLSEGLVKMDALDTDRVQLTFGSVDFGQWLDWSRNLRAHHARIEACRIEALSTAGLVSVTATLVRTRPQ